MSECVCCQAAEAKATGVDATLILLFTFVRDARIEHVMESLCPRHGKTFDRMVFGLLVGRVHPLHPLLRLDPPKTLKRKKRKRKAAE